jgi:microcystin degradation protein MlrC
MESMRVAIAALELESVSFLPSLSEIDDFRRGETIGSEMIEKYRGTNSVIGGFIDVLMQVDAEIVPILAASAGVAGPASDTAFVQYADRICADLAAAAPLDGVLLFPHGAMVTPTRFDPDRELVDRVRTVIGRTVPLMVALDYHANTDKTWSQSATAIFGYHYSPHVDQAETGARAARCLIRTARGEIRPVIAVAKPDVMVPSIFSATNLPPLSDVVAASAAMPEQVEHLLDVSIFAGFSYADVPNCGFAVVAVADNDLATVRDVAQTLSERIWSVRHELQHTELVYSVAAGLDRAIAVSATASKPVVVVEHADRMNDSTYVLREVLRRGLSRVAVPYVCDPAAAEAAIASGEGAQVRLMVGGHSSERSGGPVELDARVLFAGEKTYRGTGEVRQGKPVDLGPTAVLDANGVVVTVTSANSTAIDLDPFIQFGMRAEDFAIIVLRSKTHFRAAYEPIAEEIVLVDTPDWGPADLTTLPYRLVPVERTFPFVDTVAPPKESV